jgi:Holliday junction resolvase RusA-like endonuclease
MTTPICFFVQGFPKPAGSKRGFLNKYSGRVAIVDACKESRDWKTDVKAAARGAYSGPLLDLPLRVRFTFHLLRPKNHFGSGKNSQLIKGSAPQWPVVKPDTLKLARGVEDALTGVIWRDDCLIVDERIRKVYGDVPGVSIEIGEMVE